MGRWLRNALPRLLGWRRTFRVTGRSMLPALRPGQVVLVDIREYRRRPPRPGEVVLARHPFLADVRMIKRVRRVDETGRCFLAGDNPEESTDSRAFGPLPLHLVLGKVLS